MKRALLIALVAGCAQAQSVDTPDGSITISLAERAFIVRALAEKDETIQGLRKALDQIHVATGCT